VRLEKKRRLVFRRQKLQTKNPVIKLDRYLALAIQTKYNDNGQRILITRYYTLRKTLRWVEMTYAALHSLLSSHFSLLPKELTKSQYGILIHALLDLQKFMQFYNTNYIFLAFFFNAIDGHYVQLGSQVQQEQNPFHRKQDAWIHYRTYATNDEQCVLEC